VNAVRVMAGSLSLALGSAAAVSLLVTFVPADTARAFVAGDSDALTAADIDGIVLGLRVVIGGFAALVGAGILIEARGLHRQRRRTACAGVPPTGKDPLPVTAGRRTFL